MTKKILVENPDHLARQKDLRKGKRPPKLLAIVHQSGCTGCEVCIAGCPVDSIEIVPGPDPTNPVYQQNVEIDLARCIGCQNCAQDCPWETITMYQHDHAFTAWGNETMFTNLYMSEEEFKEKHPQEETTQESSDESSDESA